MGLLGEIYNAFGLGYSIALVALKHGDPKPIELLFMAATAAFVILSIVQFCNQCRLVPAEYQCTFFWKSLGRGLCYPLLWPFHYCILFCCCKYCKRCKRCLTFSNEAYDGVERTRQLVIFELEARDDSARIDHNLATHNLLRFKGGTWGYDRLVGDIWVRVSFKLLGNDASTVYCLKLQTEDNDTTSLLQYSRESGDPVPNPQGVIGDGDESPEVTCRDCVSGKDPESGEIPANPDPGTRTYRTTLTTTTTDRYTVTITRRWGKCRIQQIECCPGLCPGCKWILKRTVVRNWNLFQIHQYMLCLDAWGNHPKQGIWKPIDELNRPCCSGCTYWCNYCSSNQDKKGNFRYCYRHDELIKAIGDNKRLRQTWNKGTWFTVV